MDYFKLLQLKKEPFSNSPDPDFFYHSKQHNVCLQKMELALRLRRGLNVIIGDIGTGKTTLCRELIRRFDTEADIRTHLILDPSFGSATECLKLLFSMICKETPEPSPATDMALKEAIKQRLFTEGVDKKRTTVLILDEGQKITADCIEILRELLNYETNDFKLLQIVIFAQPEIEEILKRHANFADRINWLHYLAPMDFNDTRQMIYHRLKLSSRTPKPKALFTLPALWAIYRFSKGYPRKIVHLCHQSVLTMIIQNRSKAGWSIIRSCKNRMGTQKRWVRRLLLFGTLASAIVIAAAFILVPYKDLILSEKSTVPIFKIPPETSPVAEPASSPKVAVVQEISPVTAPPQVNDTSEALPVPEDPVQEPLPKTTVPEPEDEAQISQLAAVEKIETPPAAQPSTAMTSPPDMLGQLSVKPGDTLFQMVGTVYGRSSNRNMRAVIEANPHIVNPNAIDLGDIIYFPALKHQPDISKGKCHWVVVEEQYQLGQAVQRIYDLKETEKVALRMISNWNPSQGLVFSLAAKRCFPDPDDAIGYLSALPSGMVKHGHIQSEWPDGALIYSYLY